MRYGPFGASPARAVDYTTTDFMIDRAFSNCRACLRRVVLFLVMVAAAAPGQGKAEDVVRESVLTGMTQTTAAGEFTASLEFVGLPRSRAIILRHPDRIAIDLFDTVSALDSLTVEPNALVAGMRQGLVAADRYRILFTLNRPGIPILESETRDGKTVLHVKIAATDADSFERAAAGQMIGAGSDTPDVASHLRPPAKEVFTVVVDPGHGGVDTGAVGKQGTLEKEVNLRFAEALRDVLKKDGRIDVRLTREDDRYISLGERSDIARRLKADLFISMHADSIRYSGIRGATVYTLSERASDEVSREVAETENSSDRFVDPQWREGEPEVFDILIELMRRETDSFSQHFAAGLVQELGRRKIRLIGNAKRSAGFKVLTAPDVPSVLVEIGYLSNIDDEQLLLDSSWRQATATAIGAAVVSFLGTGETAREAEGG